jgi:hypothetical protein
VNGRRGYLHIDFELVGKKNLRLAPFHSDRAVALLRHSVHPENLASTYPFLPSFHASVDPQRPAKTPKAHGVRDAVAQVLGPYLTAETELE